MLYRREFPLWCSINCHFRASIPVVTPATSWGYSPQLFLCLFSSLADISLLSGAPSLSLVNFSALPVSQTFSDHQLLPFTSDYLSPLILCRPMGVGDHTLSHPLLTINRKLRCLSSYSPSISQTSREIMHPFTENLTWVDTFFPPLLLLQTLASFLEFFFKIH